jgi:hypothetical protein
VAHSPKRKRRRAQRASEFGPERKVDHIFEHEDKEYEHLECGHNIVATPLTGTVPEGKALLRRCKECKQKVRVYIFPRPSGK